LAISEGSTPSPSPVPQTVPDSARGSGVNDALIGAAPTATSTTAGTTAETGSGNTTTNANACDAGVDAEGAGGADGADGNSAGADGSSAPAAAAAAKLVDEIENGNANAWLAASEDAMLAGREGPDQIFLSSHPSVGTGGTRSLPVPTYLATTAVSGPSQDLLDSQYVRMLKSQLGELEAELEASRSAAGRLELRNDQLADELSAVVNATAGASSRGGGGGGDSDGGDRQDSGSREAGRFDNATDANGDGDLDSDCGGLAAPSENRHPAAAKVRVATAAATPSMQIARLLDSRARTAVDAIAPVEAHSSTLASKISKAVEVGAGRCR
jgi:hypothetical protein